MRRSVLLLLLILLPLLPAGCARNNLFVLMPDEDGTTGAIVVSNQGGTQEIATAYQASRVPSADRAPGPPRPISEAEVRDRFGAALAAQPRAAHRFVLYFVAGSTELTPESAALLDQIVQTARERTPADLSVVGHTDSVGSPQVNARLARERATGVAALLRARGIEGERIETASHGENNPLIPTPDETPEPRNRRVEVRVR